MDDLDDKQLLYDYKFRCWASLSSPSDDYDRASRATREKMVAAKLVPAAYEQILREAYWEHEGHRLANEPSPPDMVDWVQVDEYFAKELEDLEARVRARSPEEG